MRRDNVFGPLDNGELCKEKILFWITQYHSWIGCRIASERNATRQTTSKNNHLDNLSYWGLGFMGPSLYLGIIFVICCLLAVISCLLVSSLSFVVCWLSFLVSWYPLCHLLSVGCHLLSLDCHLWASLIPLHLRHTVLMVVLLLSFRIFFVIYCILLSFGFSTPFLVHRHSICPSFCP